MKAKSSDHFYRNFVFVHTWNDTHTHLAFHIYETPAGGDPTSALTV